MARTKEQKKELVKEYVEKIKSSKAIFITEPAGLSANQSVELKKGLFDLQANFCVVKSSLFKKALEECGMQAPDGMLNLSKAVVYSGDMISEAAKAIKTFSDSNEGVLTIKSGFLDGKSISAQEVNELAELPSRDVMLAQTLATFEAPISGFVNVLAGNVRSILNVINAIKDTKVA